MSSAQPTVYPPPPPPPPSSAPYSAPPPVGYPTNETARYPQNSVLETNSKGDGFWKGCCAALCCCCVLDACF